MRDIDNWVRILGQRQESVTAEAIDDLANLALLGRGDGHDLGKRSRSSGFFLVRPGFYEALEKPTRNCLQLRIAPKFTERAVSIPVQSPLYAADRLVVRHIDGLPLFSRLARHNPCAHERVL